MIVLGVATTFLLLLFVVWRARYRYPPRDTPQVLCYHKLSQKFCFEGTWMTPARFLGQIDHLESKGYRFIDESTFARAVAKPTPENSKKILLTRWPTLAWPTRTFFLVFSGPSHEARHTPKQRQQH